MTPLHLAASSLEPRVVPNWFPADLVYVADLDNCAGLIVDSLHLTPAQTNTAGTTSILAQQTLATAGWATKQVALANNTTPANNIGILTDGTAAGTSFDNGTIAGNSYSIQALNNATLNTDASNPNAIGAWGCPPDWDQGTECNATISAGHILQTNTGVNLDFPDPAAGTNDNYQAAGQTLPAPTNLTQTAPTHLYLLGAAANTTTASDQLTITYSDGTTATVTAQFPDWTLAGGTLNPTSIPAADTIVATTAYHITPTGANQLQATYLYLDDITLPTTTKTTASITLPTDPNLHIFTMASAAP